MRLSKAISFVYCFPPAVSEFDARSGQVFFVISPNCILVRNNGFGARSRLRPLLHGSMGVLLRIYFVRTSVVGLCKFT